MLSNTMFAVIILSYLIGLNMFMIIQIISDIEYKKAEIKGLKNHFNYKWRNGLNKEMGRDSAESWEVTQSIEELKHSEYSEAHNNHNKRHGLFTAL